MGVLGLDLEKVVHACFRIRSGGKVIYVDPYSIDTHEGADLVLITHEHFDHCSPTDLMKVVKRDTIIVAAEECRAKLEPLRPKVHEVVYVNPGGKIAVGNLDLEAVPAYNTNKFKTPGRPFHPKADKKCGYIIEVEGKRVYHAGDTDVIEEMKNISNIDVALLPASGTYVMTPDEAVEAAKIIKPKVAVPMHWGLIVGTKEDAERFADKASGFTKAVVM